MAKVRPVIAAALDYALTEERLPLHVSATEKSKPLSEAKWDRILYNAEFYMRRQGTIKLL